MTKNRKFYWHFQKLLRIELLSQPLRYYYKFTTQHKVNFACLFFKCWNSKKLNLKLSNLVLYIYIYIYIFQCQSLMPFDWHMTLHEHCWLFLFSIFPCFQPRSLSGFISHSISSWKYEVFLQHGNKQIMSTHHQHGF